MKFRKRLPFLLPSSLLALGFALGAGCSSKVGGDVSGAVTLNGKKVTAGNVVFHFEGKPSVSAAIVDGSYTLQRPPRGDATVTVEVREVPESATSKIGSVSVPAGSKPDPDKPPTPTPAPKVEKVSIPAKYKDPKTSGLSLTIGGNAQAFDVAMTGEPDEKSDKK
jgi:hypothetical protein